MIYLILEVYNSAINGLKISKLVDNFSVTFIKILKKKIFIHDYTIWIKEAQLNF